MYNEAKDRAARSRKSITTVELAPLHSSASNGEKFSTSNGERSLSDDNEQPFTTSWTRNSPVTFPSSPNSNVPWLGSNEDFVTNYQYPNPDPSISSRIETLLQEFSYISLDPQGQTRYIGGASIATLVKPLISSTAHQNAIGTNSLPYFSKPQHRLDKMRWLPNAEDFDFPPVSISSQLISKYFEFLHPLFPILDRNAFLSRCKYEVFLPRSWGTKADISFVALVFAVLACASKIPSDGFMVEEEMAVEWHDRASVCSVICICFILN